uniref:Peptidase S33 tripeptidyl aminopeptidase-like C-terminal domain-containing protein n=2 Tax=Colletotrichum fructicola (strain Nara gc5) TaxID=1213859 RepID=L2G4F5_COLFN
MGKRPIEPVVNKARLPRMPKWPTIAIACTLGVAVVQMASLPFLPWVPAQNDLDGIASYPMNKSNNDTYFDWEAVSPSRDLEYVPCYGRFQCARLLLPMDWTEQEENWHTHEVAIAMIKQPANVSILDPRYGGEIFLNPGGPGVQGVTMLTGRLNDHLVNAINSEDPDGKVFDLVSFDPRGVGFSTPRISCFDDLIARQLWHQLGTAYGDVSVQSFDLLWARARSLEKLCNAGNASSEKALFMSTVSTAFVARDLLAMVEKSGEAREQRAREALMTLHGGDKDFMVPESLQYQPGEELLQYWGFSYGTFLGGTFASLYPSRVGRMIVDGCGEWEDEASGEFLGFLLDTDNEWSEFFRLCYAVGPDNCAIYNEDGPKAMQKSVADLLETLQTNPISVYEDGMPFPDIFTRDILVQGIFGALYRPYRDSTWVKLAETLSALLNGTVPSGAVDMLPSRKFHIPVDGCKTSDCVTEGMSEGFWSEITYGIYCTDGLDFRNISKSEMAAWVTILQQQSPLFGNMFATTSKLPCVGYPARPKWRFGGPFGGKTKTPMLFIGNTFDPVAPLEGTRKNVKSFEGARLLQQDSVGHCSINAPSKCTVSYVRKYLVSGELPEEGTICSVDGSPFDENM